MIGEGIKWELVHAHMQLGHPATAPEPHTKTQQMFAALRAPLLAKASQLRLDSAIWAHLGLDKQVSTDAQAAYGLKRHARANEVTITSYNWALSQSLELETLRREAPQLLPFFPLVAQRVSLRAGYELTHQIKRWVALEVGSAGWKLMLRHGRRLFVDVGNLEQKLIRVLRDADPVQQPLNCIARENQVEILAGLAGAVEQTGTY